MFLGCTIRKKGSIQRAPTKHYMQRWPSPKVTKRLRDRVRKITGKRNSGKDVKRIIAELNPVLRGWGNYFRTGNADREFNKDVVRMLVGDDGVSDRSGVDAQLRKVLEKELRVGARVK